MWLVTFDLSIVQSLIPSLIVSTLLLMSMEPSLRSPDILVTKSIG